MINKQYTLSPPPKIIFGCDSVNTISAHLPQGFSKLLLVSGNHLTKSRLTDNLIASLNRYQITTVHGVSSEPPPEDVDAIIRVGRECSAEAVIAIGGGSVIDAAKAAAAIIPLAGTCGDYFSGENSIDGKGLFFCAVPTTSGTGAEMTCNAVLTDSVTKVKKSLRSAHMTPDLAIIDPALTLSCSPALTAASGLDAFIQAVESCTSLKSSVAMGALASEAVRQIFHNIRTAFKNPGNLNARIEMAEGSMLSAMAFSQSGLGAVHGLAHPIGSILKVPHGVACAILMPYIFEWNLPACKREYASLASECCMEEFPDTEKAAKAFINAVKHLALDLAIPNNFGSYGLGEEHFDFILKNCRSNSMSLNPRPMNDADVLDLLKKLC